MEKRVYAKKSTLIIIMIVCFLAAAGSAFYSFKQRIDDAAASEDYDHVKAEVQDVNKIYNSTDDGTRYTYEASIVFEEDGEQYAVWTDDVFHVEPDIGEDVDVMVLPDSDGEYYVASYDWMMKCYLPLDRSYDMLLFLSFFGCAGGLIMIGCVMKNGKASFFVIGLGLVLIGIGGIFLGLTTAGAPSFLIAIFGVVGVLMIIKSFKYDPGVEARKQAERETMVRQANPYYPDGNNAQMPNYYQPDGNNTQMPNYYQPDENMQQSAPQNQNYYGDSNQ